MSTLAINAGSSSIKFGLFNDDTCDRLLTGEIDWASGDRQHAQLTVRPHSGITVCSQVAVPDNATAASYAIQAAVGASNGARGITAVGHRVVHGGTDFRASVQIDGKVKAAIGRVSDLAPLHNPAALKAIEAAEDALPGKPGIAVFDTSFYANLSPKAYLYAVPYGWHQNFGIRRFGFHGISHAYCSVRAAELMGRNLPELRIITCHLGGGCSVTAVRNGTAIATTSGYSPLDGLMMGTRCGSIDAGIPLYFLRQQIFTPKELDRALNNASGLAGISGVSADLAQIEVAAAQGNMRARLAFDMFADQVRSGIGALAATLGRVDAITFTDRIGEGSPALRAAVCEGLQIMGIELDSRRNADAHADGEIATAESRARIFVIHSEEELMVAREAQRVTRRGNGCAAMHGGAAA